MALIGAILIWILRIVLGLLVLVLAVLAVALLIPVKVWLRYDTAGFAVRLQVLFFKMQLLPAAEKAARPRKEKSKNSPAAKPVKEKNAEQTEKRTARPAGAQKAEKPQPEPEKKAAAAAQQERPSREQHTEKAEQGSGTAKSDQKPAAKKTSAQPSAQKQQDPLVRRILENLPAVLGMAGRFVGAILRSLRFTHLEIVVPVSGGAPDTVARKVGKTNAWFYAIVSPLENTLHFQWKQVRVFPDYKEEYKEQLVLAGCVCGQLLPVVIAALHLLVSLKKEKIL